MFRILLFLAPLACAIEDESAPPAPPEEAAEEVEAEDVRERLSITEITGPRMHARHILLAYAEAKAADEFVTRTKDEARTLAEQLKRELAEGGDFEALARLHSDDGTGSRGGDLGVFTTGVMHKAFEQATLELEIGEQSELVETPFGFHIIERMEVVEVHVAHVLVQWEGLKRTTSGRTQAEAEGLATEALNELRGGTPFSDVAKKFSDGPAGSRGGNLGWFQKGQMVPQFDDVAFALDVGQTSDIVESPYGYHIIHRIE